MNTCTYCNQHFKDTRSLAIHQSKIHPTEFELDKKRKKLESTQHLKFKCPLCEYSFNSYIGVSSHLSDTHKIFTPIERYMLYHGIQEIPKCKCGCGNNVKFFAGKGGWFGEYLQGHKAKKSGFCTKEGLEKSVETRRARFASGELIQHNKGVKLVGAALLKAQEIAARPERRAKISKALKGKPKSEEHKKIMVETLSRNRKEILKGNPSKLEFIFADILIGMGVDHIHQYHVDGFDYDFYIPSKNLLIEIDGDYWHGNPSVFTELNNMQKKNRGLDKLKNIHADKRNFTLIRFWENDIRNNRIQIIQKLIDILK